MYDRCSDCCTTVDVATTGGLDVKSIILEGENHSSSFYAHKVWSTISSLTYR